MTRSRSARAAGGAVASAATSPLRTFGLVTIIGAAVLAATPAAAARVFFDDFNGEAGGKTAVFQTALTNFNVGGYIDVIAPDNGFGYAVDSSVIDIGGGLIGGTIQTKDWYRWEAGDTVSVSFLISGNQLRPDNPDVPFFQFDFLTDSEDYVDVERFWADGFYTTDFGPERLGSYYFLYGTVLEGDQPFVRQTFNFRPLLGGSVKFLISTYTGGGYGSLIDDFAIDISPSAAAVPEPATWLMMIAGFGLVGTGLRRRTALTPGTEGKLP